VSRTRLVAVAAVAGLLAGALVLGIGGRLAMRAVAYADPAPTRFTWIGTLQVLGAGAAWGAVTGPVLLVFDGLRARLRWTTGLVFGAVVMVLAVLGVGLVAGFAGRIVAPPVFILLTAVVFPMLFLAHGVLVDVLARRWRRFAEPLPRSKARYPETTGPDTEQRK
jgi:hypothetical protein